jgi:hypothetical protein
MHSNHQHFRVIRTIEYANLSAFGKPERRPPEKVMFQFGGARMFEAEQLTALRVDP